MRRVAEALESGGTARCTWFRLSMSCGSFANVSTIPRKTDLVSGVIGMDPVRCENVI